MYVNIGIMIGVIIFDLDGTLLYTLEDLKDSVNFALKKYNYDPISLEQTKKFVGNGVRKLIERAIPDGEQNINFEECLKTFKTDYSENMCNKTKPYDGVLKVLEKIKNMGIKTAVVSNKFDSAAKELCKRYFGNLIDIVVGQSDSIPQKPSPESILKVIKYFGYDAENCIYVGDSEVDIQTAKNASIPCISVIWGYREKDTLEKAGAKTIINKPEEILGLLV